MRSTISRLSLVNLIAAKNRIEASNGAGLGPSSDLAEATLLAGRALFEWGFGNQLAHIPIDITLQYGTPQAAIAKVDDSLRTADQIARKIIETYQEDVLRIAETMVEERELSVDRISELLGAGEGKPPKFD